jgi:flavorubredoxin
MAVRLLKKNIYEVGAIDWDRDLFEDLTPLPEGTSYNAYIIFGSEKTALIDTVDETKTDELFKNLDKLGVKKIDYIIPQHAEQDHSSSLPEVLAKYKTAKILTNKKCKELLIMHLPLTDDQFQVVEDGEKLSLGDKTLEFIMTPWVHWPETMVSYLHEDKILFSCDFMGGHITSSELFVTDERNAYKEAKLYYADILMPFRKNIQNHFERLKPYDIKIIAPSHGQVYNKPEMIMNAYKEWISDEVKNLVVIPYASTHNSVAKMVEYFVDALIERGVNAKPYHVTRTDIGALSIDLVDCATVVMGSSTYIVGPHPEMAYIAFLVNTIRPKMKYLSFLSSYAWATKAIDILQGMITNIKPEVLPPVVSKGTPSKEVFDDIDRLADEIAEKHKSLGIL